MAFGFREFTNLLNKDKRVAEIAKPEAPLDAVSFLRQLPVQGLCVKELSLLAREWGYSPATGSTGYGNYLDLDPTYRDAWGQPLLRMTFEFPENDIRMSAFVTDKMLQIGRAMGGKTVAGAPAKRPYNATIYQTTHNTGGAIMGADPRTSVVNRYLQCWDVPNVFVIGASAYPQNATYNPTGTLGALTYWVADALKTKYLRSPGPLVPT